MIIKTIYEGSALRERVATGTRDTFQIGVGVHQGSVLSSVLFIVEMEEVTQDCRSGDPWELL